MPMMRPALTRRIRKEKEQRTMRGGEQALALHPQQHDTVILILDIPCRAIYCNSGSFAGHFDGLLGVS